jgi:hypothetical protein
MTIGATAPPRRKFLDAIDAAVPADLDVHLIIDNYGTHKTPPLSAVVCQTAALSCLLLGSGGPRIGI